jgi:hypothetical protein
MPRLVKRTKIMAALTMAVAVAVASIGVTAMTPASAAPRSPADYCTVTRTVTMYDGESADHSNRVGTATAGDHFDLMSTGSGDGVDWVYGEDLPPNLSGPDGWIYADAISCQ